MTNNSKAEKSGEQCMFDSTPLLLAALGVSAFGLAFVEYKLTSKKRMENKQISA